jgi:peptidoglycan/LPS O-acetylase OafA/YrhL
MFSSKRINDALVAQRLSLFAVLKKVSKGRILEIDILRTIAILLVVAGNAIEIAAKFPSVSGSPISETVIPPLGSLFVYTGLLIFFFASGFSLTVNKKTIKNREGAFSFYKRRAVRILPLYWFFIVGAIIVTRPSFIQSLIYVAGLQALFYPTLIHHDAYHFLSVIIIYYLLFPMIVFFDDYRKLVTVSFIPLLFFAALLQFGFTDPMLLGYYALFVGGVIAAKSGIYDKMRRMESNRFFVLTVLVSVALLSLLVWGDQHSNSAVLTGFLANLCGVPLVLIILYWATIYVKVLTRNSTLFSPSSPFRPMGSFSSSPPPFHC